MEQVFKEYEQRYLQVFNLMYPSEGSTGFTERNLTVNFSKAYEKVYSSDQVATWFEFQFEKNNHLDALIVNETKKIIYLIESKRYSNQRKEESIASDITRIQRIVSSNLIGERIPNINQYEFYGIILADVWIENEYKKNKYLEYLNKSNLNETYFNDKLKIKGKFFVNEFNKDIKIYPEVYQKYKLLSFVWKIDKSI